MELTAANCVKTSPDNMGWVLLRGKDSLKQTMITELYNENILITSGKMEGNGLTHIINKIPSSLEMLISWAYYGNTNSHLT